jgi:uncharacterized protein
MQTMSRLFALVLAALALWQVPLAAKATEPAAAASAIGALERAAGPALWKVADEDTTIYVFGTIHILPPGIEWFDGRIRKAFDSSQLLVTEITRDDPTATQALILGKAMLKEGGTLRDLLSAEQRAAYEQALSDLGMPLAMFDRFEPWYVSVSLSTLPLMRDGFAEENGVERFLETQASQRGMPQVGLETAEYQLSLFDTLPLGVQKTYLAKVVSELPNLSSVIKSMIRAWQTGDAEELARLVNSEQSDPVLIEQLLVRRNKAWAQWIDQRLEEPGTVFVAVGAGHLAGPASVQDQLLAMGIASQRIQ